MTNYNKIKIGDRAEIKHLITKDDIEKFVQLTGDDNRLHVDEEYAKSTTFKSPVVHGMLSASFISTIIGTKIPGDGALWFSQQLEFLLPVRVGDEISVIAEVIKKNDRLEVIELSTDVFNQDRQKVISGISKVKVVSSETTLAVDESIKPASTALVIGATGGIGRSVVYKLASKGYDVAIHYNRNKKLAEKLCDEIRELGVKAFPVRADLLNDEEIRYLVDLIERKFDRLSLYVNAATVPLPNIKFESLIWDDIKKHLEINIKANFSLIQLLLPLMKKQNYGKIITLLTQAIEQPNPEWLHYITAKSALSGFSKALAVELAKYGIRVNMVSPGMTNTDLIANIPNKIQLLNAAKTPLKKIADASDIANAIMFLSSRESDFLTGETVRVNGGQVMI